MKTFPIKEQTLEAVFGYLARCPFVDVDQIINMLRQDIQAAKMPPPEQEKKKLEMAQQPKPAHEQSTEPEGTTYRTDVTQQQISDV